MAQLAGELPELFQNMSGRLDSRMLALRKLIRDADRAIEQLSRLRSEPLSSPPSESTLPAALSDNEIDSLEPIPARTAEIAESKPADASDGDAADLRSERYAHVYSLADRGLDPAGISCETGMHRGEVELVLNLRRKRVRVDRGRRLEPSSVIRSTEEAPA
jgi:hypothetical protein